MAGDWIIVENVTPDKPEIFQIAEQFGIDPDAVLGKVIRIWIWADQQTYDGDAGSVTLALLDRVAGMEKFGKALQRAGWLRKEGGRFVFPNFDRHNGQTAKQRALTRKRMAKLRGKTGDAPGVTKSSPEKRREEKSSCTNVQETPLPPLIDTAEFRTAWADWRKHRKEIGKPVKPTAAANKLRQLETWGAARAVAAIRHSIGNGWQGIFEEGAQQKAGCRTLPTGPGQVHPDEGDKF